MPDLELNTIRLCGCVERWQAGDRAAADELLQAAGNRLELLARKMLRSFPNVRQRAETADVLQSSLMRLLHSLRKLSPTGTGDFFGLAALHIRRELLDLARHFARKPETPIHADSTGTEQIETPTSTDHGDLELWRRFHEAVDELPADEREVVGLTFYHGWTQAQIAELLKVGERTIRRRWHSACLKLKRLAGELPPD